MVSDHRAHTTPNQHHRRPGWTVALALAALGACTSDSTGTTNEDSTTATGSSSQGEDSTTESSGAGTSASTDTDTSTDDSTTGPDDSCEGIEPPAPLIFSLTGAYFWPGDELVVLLEGQEMNKRPLPPWDCSFSLGPDQQAPGTYEMIPGEACNNYPIVIEVIELTETCLSARLLEGGHNDGFLAGIGSGSPP